WIKSRFIKQTELGFRRQGRRIAPVGGSKIRYYAQHSLRLLPLFNFLFVRRFRERRGSRLGVLRRQSDAAQKNENESCASSQADHGNPVRLKCKWLCGFSHATEVA